MRHPGVSLALFLVSNFEFPGIDLSGFSQFEPYFTLVCLLLVCFVLLGIVQAIPRGMQKRRGYRIKRDIRRLPNTVSEMTPQTFFHLRNAHYGGRGKRHISSSYDFPGIYILFNHTKNMYYVGQGVRLFQRVNNHLTGHGNGDVYADYRYGDKFTIKLIPLEGSGFRSLNELERRAIHDYGAFAYGYNKTRGNRG